MHASITLVDTRGHSAAALNNYEVRTRYTINGHEFDETFTVPAIDEAAACTKVSGLLAGLFLGVTNVRTDARKTNNVQPAA